jgi:cobalt-zinc-cadmium efflux system membrane fusion protein
MKTNRFLFYSLSLILLFQLGCKEKAIENIESTKFILGDSIAQLLTFDTVKTEAVQNELKLTGKITYNEEKVIKIFPLLGGTAQSVKVELGDYVKAGQVLAIINSSEVATLEQEKIAADAGVIIAKKNVDAMEEMNTAGVNSQKDLLLAQKEYEKAVAEQKRISTLYGIYNISNSEYVIKSPISGYVVEKKINQNMQIRSDNTDNLFTISGLEDVWVSANVYESDIDKIKEGYEADVTTLTYNGKIFKGKVDKVYNVLDPESKVMKIRIKLPNPGIDLKPEMFANVTIRYKENLSLPAVPSESVVFDDSKNFVVVYKSRTDIDARPIKIYKTVNGITYLSEGLQAGEVIVSKYHLLIYDSLTDN